MEAPVGQLELAGVTMKVGRRVFVRQRSVRRAHVAAAVPGEIDRIILLAPMEIGAPDRIRGRKLYITSRDDLGSDDKPRLPGIRAQFEKAPGPKKWVVLDGSAHGQRIFGTNQGGRLRREILQFLGEP